MSNETERGFGLLFSRLWWMIVGPMLAVLLATSIARMPHEPFGVADFVYFAVVAVMIASRFFEFRSGTAMTARGDAMTSAIMARYAIAIAILGAAGWGLAKWWAWNG